MSPLHFSFFIDFDPADVLVHSLQRDLHISFPDKPRELLSPLDEQNAVLTHKIIQAQSFQLSWRVYAIEIDVIDVDFRSAIFVDQRKRGTGYILLRGRLESLGNALDQCRLAHTQISPQQDQLRGL